jgi:hypothetical protein
MLAGAMPDVSQQRSGHVRGALVAAAICIAVLVFSAGAAGACEPPQIRGELQEKEVFATRAHIATRYEAGESFPPATVTWRGSYATSEDVAKNVWTTAGGATEEEDNELIQLGQFSPKSGYALERDLAPGTSYVARFEVEDECSREEYAAKKIPQLFVERRFEFTTLPAGKPEVGETNSGTSFRVGSVNSTSIDASADIEDNGGGATEYTFEYALSPHGSWTKFGSNGAGTISESEEFATPTAVATGLEPERTYYVRLTAHNPLGKIEQTESVTMPTARPIVSLSGNGNSIRNVVADSAAVNGSVVTNGVSTSWRFEIAAADGDEPGPFHAVPGGSGTISEAEAKPTLPGNPRGGVSVGAQLTGLAAGTVYYVRLFAESSFGEGENVFGEPVLSETRGLESFETEGPPVTSALATHGVHGEATRLIGYVNPNGAATSGEQTVTVEGAPTGGTFTLTFEGETTAPIAFDASAASVQEALNDLSKLKEAIAVVGADGGPYTVYAPAGHRLGGDALAALTASSEGLQPSGNVSVVVLQKGGEAYDAHYHFEYVSEKQFEESGFSGASSTGEVDLGTGAAVKFMGEDLPGLTAGETYRYRISATNDSPGNPVVHGTVQTVTVPRPVGSSTQAACANEARRTGPSANLPDCRAYEMLTPVDKEGSQEIFRYDGLQDSAFANVGEDGDHLLLQAPVTWGSQATSGQSPFVFSRDEGSGWEMTSVSAQPEAGVRTYLPEVYSSTLTQVGLEVSTDTQAPSTDSKEAQFAVGAPGGPYTTVASVPKSQIGAGWVAASPSFSKLILQVEDRRLVTPHTTTSTGDDIYEYAEGALRQVNVGIGTCGASIVVGNEEVGYGHAAYARRAVSEDGSRVLFEAVPGSDCSQPKHVYMRVSGSETLDLGAGRFVAANAQGSRVLLEETSGEHPGLYIYTTETKEAEYLEGTEDLVKAGNGLDSEVATVSSDLGAIYLLSAERLSQEAPALAPEITNAKDVYRYDLAARKLTFVAQIDTGATLPQMSDDGRFFYFTSREVGGLPGGALAEWGGREELNHNAGPAPIEPTEQVYRYDSVEGSIECVSCASSFDPQPKLGANFGADDNAQGGAVNGIPNKTMVSSDGEFAFFMTPAALVPQDVDGEVIPEGDGGDPEHASNDNSVSGDVYEWRREGVDGCVHLQGCLALITNGRGGYLNLLLGSAEEGRDVFIYTSSQLVPQDRDLAGDIYDARIEGGFPQPPPRPTECEGDVCATPAGAPNDATPSSLTFNGAGNDAQASGEHGAQAKKSPSKRKKRRRKVRHGRVSGRHHRTPRRAKGRGGR